MKNVLGIPSQHERVYAQPEQLADVMALIQVLSLDPRTHRSEEGLFTISKANHVQLRDGRLSPGLTQSSSV